MYGNAHMSNIWEHLTFHTGSGKDEAVTMSDFELEDNFTNAKWLIMCTNILIMVNIIACPENIAKQCHIIYILKIRQQRFIKKLYGHAVEM